MAKPTLDHVAKQAGVSVTTASLVLAGKGNISEAVRLRVLESMQALGYRRKNPNGSRQAEKGNAVSIVVPFDDQWAHTLHFIRPVIVELEKVLVAENLFPVLQPVYHESDLEETVSRITGGSIKGVFSIQYGNTKLFQKLETMGIPVVVVMNNNFQDTFFSICVDDFQGAYEGSVHLIRLGHRHIAYMDYPRPDLPAAVTDRYIGFKKALDEYGVSFSEGMRLTLPFGDSEVLRRGLETLFAGQSGPEAIFVHDDYFAVRIIRELDEMGIRVPEDVSLIAPGDVLDYSEPFIPPITTMRIDTAMMGQLAGELLLKRLRDPGLGLQVLKVKQQLVERGSCLPRDKNKPRNQQ